MSPIHWRILTIVLVFAAPSAFPSQAEAQSSFEVRVSGKGRPLVFIPGLASSGETWNSTIERYRDRFECHVLTLAGFAGVPPIDGPLMATVQKELASYIRTHHLDRPIIVGHSLGGVIALALAARDPDLVGALVIVDALPFTAGGRFQAATAAAAEPAIAASHASMAAMSRADYERYVRSGDATKYMVKGAKDLETLERWALASDSRTVADSLAEFYRLDLREEIGRITAPVLVLGTWIGIHDEVATYGVQLERVLFEKTFADQYARLKGVRVVLSDTARHFIMFDEPTWFFQQLDAFVAAPMSTTRERGFE